MISPRFLLLALLFPALNARAQITLPDYTVQVSCTAQDSPPALLFDWPADADANGYEVYRKPHTSTVWGIALALLPGTATSWTDTSIAAGESWDYYFRKTASGYTGYGYVTAGLRFPAVESRGILLLVNDTTATQSISAEVNRLISDLEGDGWQVQVLDCDRADAVAAVKARIVSAYNAAPSLVKSVFLLGHVPVPYSGNIAPDGHVPDHQGAWPADVYYGDLNGNWTDVSVNNSGASRPENRNVPGDGKFDQNNLSSDVELQVGRVDFANMSFFPESEAALLRRYLDKDHAWRHKQFTVASRAVVDDNFGVFAGPPLENFATSGYRNFSSFVGAANVVAGDYRTEMSGGQSCLWSYGCGAGSYTSAAGVTTTSDFVNDSLSGVFTMIFGSYHGDWDVSDNLMRAALASKGTILTCSWAGRPQWHYYSMGLGHPIGRAAQVTQFSTGSQFVSGSFPRYVHVALLGDPSLRMHIVAPPTGLVITPLNSARDNQLTWTASTDAVLGYYVYRSDSGGPFVRITPAEISSTTITDYCPGAGDHRYMVRALRLELCFSGSYYNLSQGLTGDATNGGAFTLTTLNPAGTTFCAGDTVMLPFQTGGPFCGNNQFGAELSDAAGSFAAPLLVGTLSDSVSGSVMCLIPSGLAAGTGYRLRVTSDSPTLTAADNGTNLTILALPVASFTASIFSNVPPVGEFSNASTGGTSVWNFGDGTQPVTDNATTVQHNFPGIGIYTVTLVVTNACGSDTLTQTIDFPMSVGDSEPVHMNIFPNPAGEGVHISISGARLEKVTLTTPVGQVLCTQAESADETQLALHGLPAGLYYVSLTTDKGMFTRALLKK